MTAVMPNRAIEIHDSVLASVSFSQGDAQLYFSSVYIHQSEGVPGRDPGSGWVQRAVLRIRDAKMEGTFSEFPVDLTDGQTRMGQNILDNEIPVPLRHAGAFDCACRQCGRGSPVTLRNPHRRIRSHLPDFRINQDLLSVIA